MRNDLPKGTVTFLFTDVEGSTRLLHELGPKAYADALDEHRWLLRGAFAAEGGIEVDTQGDAFFVVFPTAKGAVAAALAARDALSGGPIRVRIGLHTGAPVLGTEGYVGVDVHRAARVTALAHGGQILASPTTVALLDGQGAADLGLHRLKDFEGATRLHQIGDGVFPPLRTPGSIDLPTPATRFLGRDRELFEAVSLAFERDPRVFTILGPGGTGKTRFAIELARLLAEDAEGGTVFVPLAPLRDADLVLPALADRLGAAAPDARAVSARVGDRRTHVVVDNLEHLLPAAARPLAELAEHVPALRLVVTSREALRIQGEAQFDLPPLVSSDAVALFCERAQAVRPDVSASRTVTELCERLDRLPLALELAAARTKLLTPELLLDRLGDRLDALKGTRDADERHATLRATIAWSYDLLDEADQRLFARLSVFRGGCTLEMAAAVCDADLDTLASLLDKSLVRRRTGRIGEERYWMLETIRAFALEQLAESSEETALRRRHAERMLEIARQAHLTEDDDEPFEQNVALAEREDLRAALDWTPEHDPELGLELAVALENLWSAHAPDEGVRRLRELLEQGVGAHRRLRARALRVLAGSAHQERDFDLADPCYEESLRLFTEIDDRRGMASVRTRLAYRAAGTGDLALARRLVDESQRDAEGSWPLIEAQNTALLGQIAREEDKLDEAEDLLQRGRELASVLQWAWWEANMCILLLDLALRRGDVDEAERQGRQALAIDVEQEHAISAMHAVAGLARTALARDELERAGVLWGAVSERGKGIWGLVAHPWFDALDVEMRPSFAAAFERGRELDLWDAAAIALGDDSQTVP